VSLPEPVASYEPGASFRAEIREQPQALRRLLEHDAEFARIADAMRERGPLVRIVGHGSSDNAATYGVYAFGVLAGRTALRDSIALTVYYDAAFDLTGSTVLGLSQSGQTPDVVEYLQRARRRGASRSRDKRSRFRARRRPPKPSFPRAGRSSRSRRRRRTSTSSPRCVARRPRRRTGSGRRRRPDVSEQLEEALPALEAQVARSRSRSRTSAGCS
jgi:glucosamine--fructose-6-phosphate aminotransferase (isomerizing)